MADVGDSARRADGGDRSHTLFGRAFSSRFGLRRMSSHLPATVWMVDSLGTKGRRESFFSLGSRLLYFFDPRASLLLAISIGRGGAAMVLSRRYAARAAAKPLAGFSGDTHCDRIGFCRLADSAADFGAPDVARKAVLSVDELDLVFRRFGFKPAARVLLVHSDSLSRNFLSHSCEHLLGKIVRRIVAEVDKKSIAGLFRGLFFSDLLRGKSERRLLQSVLELQAGRFSGEFLFDLPLHL